MVRRGRRLISMRRSEYHLGGSAPRPPSAILRIAQTSLTVVTEALAGTLLIAALIVMCVGVTDRFYFQSGMTWTEEAARYLVVWVAFLSAALAFGNRSHYAIELVTMAARKWPSWGRGHDMAFYIVSITILSSFWLPSINVTMVVASQNSAALGISRAWVFASLPAALTLSIAFMFIGLIGSITHRGEGDSVC